MAGSDILCIAVLVYDYPVFSVILNMFHCIATRRLNRASFE